MYVPYARTIVGLGLGGHSCFALAARAMARSLPDTRTQGLDQSEAIDADAPLSSAIGRTAGADWSAVRPPLRVACGAESI